MRPGPSAGSLLLPFAAATLAASVGSLQGFFVASSISPIGSLSPLVWFGGLSMQGRFIMRHHIIEVIAELELLKFLNVLLLVSPQDAERVLLLILQCLFPSGLPKSTVWLVPPAV